MIEQIISTRNNDIQAQKREKKIGEKEKILLKHKRVYINQKEKIDSSIESLIQFVVDERDPFQFISKILRVKGGKTNPTKIPITQDASTCAFQLTIFFLLDIEIAKQTNLI